MAGIGDRVDQSLEGKRIADLADHRAGPHSQGIIAVIWEGRLERLSVNDADGIVQVEALGLDFGQSSGVTMDDLR